MLVRWPLVALAKHLEQRAAQTSLKTHPAGVSAVVDNVAKSLEIEGDVGNFLGR